MNNQRTVVGRSNGEMLPVLDDVLKGYFLSRFVVKHIPRDFFCDKPHVKVVYRQCGDQKELEYFEWDTGLSDWEYIVNAAHCWALTEENL